jgi:hypothetical protein
MCCDADRLRGEGAEHQGDVLAALALENPGIPLQLPHRVLSSPCQRR